MAAAGSPLKQKRWREPPSAPAHEEGEGFGRGSLGSFAKEACWQHG
jgi:hypothetical protein